MLYPTKDERYKLHVEAFIDTFNEEEVDQAEAINKLPEVLHALINSHDDDYAGDALFKHQVDALYHAMPKSIKNQVDLLFNADSGSEAGDGGDGDNE